MCCAGLVAAGHAALNVRAAQGVVAWTLFLLMFPFLGLPKSSARLPYLNPDAAIETVTMQLCQR